MIVVGLDDVRITVGKFKTFILEERYDQVRTKEIYASEVVTGEFFLKVI